MTTPHPHPSALVILLPFDPSAVRPDVVDLRDILGGRTPRGKPHIIIDNDRKDIAR